MAKQQIPALRGLIVPISEENLKDVWWAFQDGSTWRRVGRSSKQRARFRHEIYGGELFLEWWGPALSFEIIQDTSGKFSGAFVGHVQRHGRDTVDRIDIRFEDEE
jgi:hypothetical protein